jgi:hypothetical protein
MSTDEIRLMVGKRIIFRGEFGLHETYVKEVSPSGKYVKLGNNDIGLDAVTWWRPVDDTDIVEVLPS